MNDCRYGMEFLNYAMDLKKNFYRTINNNVTLILDLLSLRSLRKKEWGDGLDVKVGEFIVSFDLWPSF